MLKQVITFHYTLTDKKGNVIDFSTGKNPLIFLEGSGQIIPGLEAVLVMMNKGGKKDVHIPYQEAYGPYDEKLISKAPRHKFPATEIKVGDAFQVGGGESYQIVTVIEVGEIEITLDGNHPLAGQDLSFSVEIVDRRDATAEELAHGHVHGAGGHHH